MAAPRRPISPPLTPYRATPPVARPRPPAPPPLAGRSRELNHGAPVGWTKALPVCRDYRVSQPVLYAVIGTWHEGDVIEATVKNCLANGCTKVFIVDNDSPDNTRDVAVAAGAVIAKNYTTQFYDDDLRLKLMNEVMQEVTAKEKLPSLWWLSLDADEFPCGPSGQTVLNYLQSLDPRINCIGANAVDLYPTELPHYIPGAHPADCMAQGLRRKSARGVFCDQSHWKHPLLRYENGDFNMAQTRGSHIPFTRMDGGRPAVIPTEPTDELVLFHAPMRAKEATFKRLEILCTKQAALGGQHRSAGDDHATQANGAIKRWKSLEDVYAGRWDQVELPHSQIYGGSVTGIALFPWQRIVPKVKSFPRWENYPIPITTPADTKVALPLA